MSLVPAVVVSGIDPEKNASSPISTGTSISEPAPARKVQSCVTCRSRKVRCDKQSPCSNCRRANIACVFASTDRPPRWARRLERLNNNTATSTALAPQSIDSGVGKVMDRLRNLESLVRELSGQLEQAHAAASSVGGGSSGPNSPASSTLTQDRDGEHHRETSAASDSNGVEKQFGRLVLQNAGGSRYVSSGFWSCINDELDGLKTETRDLAGHDSDSSEDAASPEQSTSTKDFERTPSARQAFLFRNNLNTSIPDPDLRKYHPLPSQIPFLLDLFSENVNTAIQLVHVPTVTKMIRNSRGSDKTRLTPPDEALMFSIYYAAITSMEEDDIMTNFGLSKPELILKYRLGLEYALAKADFLNAPNIVLVQAFALFLCVVRQHDSPRYVWMMTGLLIRMAQYLGLQRDGTHFEQLNPFQIEMRRRVWWAVCLLDLRTSEDQGTDLTIVKGSFDTKIPLNINDADISPESKEMPVERTGVTDMSFTRINAGLCDLMRRLMEPGRMKGAAGLEDQSRMLNEIYQRWEEGYLQHTRETGNISYWVADTVARLVMAKMSLIVFLPVLFAAPSEDVSDEMRTKLLISAIEVAEYNHALHAEEACRHWRWIWQTYTHWHAIVYLMIEVSRRPWSPIVERSWVALHSSWLIPAQTLKDKNLRIWVPLRKFMAKAHKHRDAELARLRADPQAAARLEAEDQKLPLPSSSGPNPTGSGVENFRRRWRQLVVVLEAPTNGIHASGTPQAGLADPSMHTTPTNQPTIRSLSAYVPDDLTSNTIYPPETLDTSGYQGDYTLQYTNAQASQQATTTAPPNQHPLSQTSEPPYPSTLPTNWSTNLNTMDPDASTTPPYLWTDPSLSDNSLFSNWEMDSLDTNMDLDLGSEVNWYNWVQSAKGMGTMMGSGQDAGVPEAEAMAIAGWGGG